jgi:hypothetical protein
MGSLHLAPPATQPDWNLYLQGGGAIPPDESDSIPNAEFIRLSLICIQEMRVLIEIRQVCVTAPLICTSSLQMMI